MNRILTKAFGLGPPRFVHWPLALVMTCYISILAKVYGARRFPKAAMSQQSSTSQSRFPRLASGNASSLTSAMFSRKRLWIGPAVTAVLIAIVGWWTHRSVENAVKTNLAGQLQTLLDADVAALELWLAGQRANAMVLASDNRVHDAVVELFEIAQHPDSESIAAELLSSKALKSLRENIGRWIATHHVQGFVLIDSEALILAGDVDMGIGDPAIAKPFMPALAPVFRGETIVLPPLKSTIVLPDIDGTPRAGIPVMFVATPVLLDDEQAIAALCLRIRPEEEFTKILQVARAGESGETYAFNAEGLLITNSRFDNELKRLGLLPDEEATRSLLNVQIRDPGVDMTQGHRPALRRPDQPLTRMAAAAVAGESGVDVNVYRDYRGVPVVGAWTWLPEYAIGVATEVDASEAFRPLYALRLAFAVVAGMLLATTLALFGLTFYASNLELRARRSALEARRLGQYALGEQIGAGGMGVVYRAHHDMLHRPTAVKLLHVDKADEQAIARFEREVQLTSQLTHPNTIAIYDYGRTPEGVFYYAMEYLDGLSLDDLVRRFGPLPESRVIHLLRQLCGSLSEAHGLGLIHRDIKPANIMLTKCGGMCDFVKLLDFGLVKPQNAERNMTLAGSLTGTPLYLSPEAIQHAEIDARSDLYAVGAVGYFLLTGEPVFDGQSVVDICTQHIQAAPDPPSQRLAKPVDEDLEQVILRCLAKQPDERPSAADALEEALSQCRSATEWTQMEAKAWWTRHLNDQSLPSDTATPGPALTETIIKPHSGN